MFSKLYKWIPAVLGQEELAFRLIPKFTLEVIRRYLRVSVSGVENVPTTGRVIIISNHSGYAGFDAIMLQNEIKRARNRVARLVAHRLWFFGKPVEVVAKKMGLVEANTEECLRLLNKDLALILFPEGETGNFKPSSRRYRLQEFKRGFVRLAITTGAPIIPAFVIGAEETHINLSQITWSKYLVGTVIPVPLNIIPLPVQWTIKFLPPIYLNHYSPEQALDRKIVYAETMRIRHLLQRAIISELRHRKANSLPAIDFSEDDVPGT